MTVRVRLDRSDRVFEAKPGDDLLEVFQSNGEPIATSCGGVALCGLCRVTIVSGAAALVPIKPQELVHLGNVAKVVGLRLACQSQVLPVAASAETGAATDIEIVVRIPEMDDVEQRKRKKAERSRQEHRAGSAAGPSSAPRPARIEWRPGRTSEPQKGDEGKGGT